MTCIQLSISPGCLKHVKANSNSIVGIFPDEKCLCVTEFSVSPALRFCAIFSFWCRAKNWDHLPANTFFLLEIGAFFQINSVVMPGTKEEKALRLKFSSLRKKVCLGHHPISHRPWRIDQKCWTVDESEMKRADERAEENRSRRGCIIYLKP